MRLWLSITLTLLVLLALTSCQPPTVVPSAPSPKQIRGSMDYWHIVKDHDDRWWFIDPNGHREFVTAVTTVQPFQVGKTPEAPHYRSHDLLDGDLNAWASVTAARVKGYGFKAVGAWSHPSLHPFMPYTRDLNLLASVHAPLSSPEWEAEVEAIIKERVTPLRNDKNLIGYYTDNELKWQSSTELQVYADKYFEVVTRLIRKHDPNHLILGVRFNARPPLSVLRASKGHVDAQSVNVYSDDGTLWHNMMREITLISDSPVIISEFSFYSNENRSGNKNTAAWWAGVRDQEARASMYSRFVSGCAAIPWVIGTEMFQFSDEPPGGRSSDGEDINVGIVDIFDQPYEPLVRAARKTSDLVNSIHATGAGPDIWKADPERPLH